MTLQVAINCLDSDVNFIALHILFNIGGEKMQTPGCKSHLCLSFLPDTLMEAIILHILILNWDVLKSK